MRLILVILIGFVVAAPAQASPRALTPLGDDEGFALAGDRVLFTQTSGRTLNVRSMALTGGPARTIFTVVAPPGLSPYGVQLSASPQRAAMLVAYLNGAGEANETELFAGAPAGGWSVLTPRRAFDSGVPIPNVANIDAERVFAYERIGDGDEDYQVVVYDPVRRVLALPVGAVFAGDVAAYTAASDQGDHQRLMVVNWRTGQQISTADFPDRIGDRRIRSDGAAVVTVDDVLYEVDPGAAPRRLATGVSAPGFAGDRLLFYRGGMRVLDRDGGSRAFGIPTAQLERFVADERNVLWSANGCLLVAPITDPPASEPGPGPCARSEFALPTQRLKQARTVPVRLRCVAASARGCRGTLRLRAQGHIASSARSLRIPVGQSRTVRVRLTRTGLSRIVRASSASVDVTLPGGHRQPGLPDLYPSE